MLPMVEDWWHIPFRDKELIQPLGWRLKDWLGGYVNIYLQVTVDRLCVASMLPYVYNVREIRVGVMLCKGPSWVQGRYS